MQERVAGVSVCIAKCLNLSTVTRAHVPRQRAAGAPAAASTVDTGTGIYTLIVLALLPCSVRMAVRGRTSCSNLAGIEVCFCASFLAQTKKERGATSGLLHKAAVQISLV